MRVAILFRVLIFSVLFIRTTPLAPGQSFVITIENPGIQQSSLSKVPVDPFDEFGPSGKNPKPVFLPGPVPFAGNAALGLGNYDHLLVVPADNFGGAGGTGSYMLVSSNFNKASSPTTLTLNKSQRYVGFWWSFGDSNNTVSFYSGGTLIETFTTSDVVNFIGTQQDAKLFKRQSEQRQGQWQALCFFELLCRSLKSEPNVQSDRFFECWQRSLSVRQSDDCK